MMLQFDQHETPSELPLLSCGKFLGLLEGFYQGLPAAPSIEAALIVPDDIPQPQRRLLVHHRDMTSTLHRHYQEPIALRVLERKLSGDWYYRHIVLQTGQSGRPIEYGAIRIDLPLLSEAAREEVLTAQTPLGSILNAHHLAYRCCPGAFFRIRPNELMHRVLQLQSPRWLYGRCNCLSDNESRTIAEVIEILPP